MVYRLVNATYNVKELTLRLTRLLCQFIKADSSFIYLLDPKKKKLILKAVFNNKINILQTKQKELTVTRKEKRVLEGFSVLEPAFIGLPLVADEIVGAIFLKRRKGQAPFTDFDREMLSVVVEQSVTAIKNLQLQQEQEKIILENIRFISKLLRHHGFAKSNKFSSSYFRILEALGEKLRIGKEAIDNLYYASILRDAGALEIPYKILSKTSQLTPEEFKVIRKSPTKSAELIRPVEFLKPVLPIILYHHEHYDGTGYPSGLKKEQIPLGARIMCVVNAFEAMLSERPYRKKYSFGEALEEIRLNSGTQFDPKVAAAFIELASHKKFKNYLRLIK